MAFKVLFMSVLDVYSIEPHYTAMNLLSSLRKRKKMGSSLAALVHHERKNCNQIRVQIKRNQAMLILLYRYLSERIWKKGVEVQNIHDLFIIRFMSSFFQS